ncbi:hypothetical protein [Xanthobacter variabilis]|uniref:hypothetical protein n=1 Tax=Xanthobacter variabilis TaxID=3119932 RepID=UPI00372ADE2B
MSIAAALKQAGYPTHLFSALDAAEAQGSAEVLRGVLDLIVTEAPFARPSLTATFRHLETRARRALSRVENKQ